MAFLVEEDALVQGPASAARRPVDVTKVAVWVAGLIAPWMAIILAARVILAALA